MVRNRSVSRSIVLIEEMNLNENNSKERLGYRLENNRYAGLFWIIFNVYIHTKYTNICQILLYFWQFYGRIYYGLNLEKDNNNLFRGTRTWN